MLLKETIFFYCKTTGVFNLVLNDSKLDQALIGYVGYTRYDLPVPTIY